MTRFGSTCAVAPVVLALPTLFAACAIDSRDVTAPDPVSSGLAVRPSVDAGAPPAPTEGAVAPAPQEPASAGAGGPAPQENSSAGRPAQESAAAAVTCPSGQHACAGGCVRNDDPSTCGQGCSPCAAPTGGKATCDGVACGTSCPMGAALCNGACIDATALCSGSCPAGTQDCGGLCVALDSVSACGAACAPCPVPAGGSATCSMGQCAGQCPSDQQLCNGACVSKATCCTPCTDGFACVGGHCPSACSSDGDCIADHFCNGGKCIGRVIQLAAGAITPTACSLHSDGLVRCWGDDEDGEFGTASGPGPVVVPLPMAAKQIAIGNRQVCAVMSDSSLWCWADVPVTIGDNYIAPAPYQGLTNVTSVVLSNSVGGCVAHENGTVSCWGINTGGLLGRGTNDDGFSLPDLVPGLSDVVELSRGEFHMCARFSTGEMTCWGDNSFGAVGIGTLNPSTLYIDPQFVLSPSAVPSITGAKQIAAGSGASFALLGGTNDGVLMAWGNDVTRGAGDSNQQALVTPTRLGGGLFRAVSAGSGSGIGCAITNSGGVQCWGIHTLAGTILEDLAPVDIAGVQNATALGVGGDFACALVGPTQIMCWGDNTWGQLGNSSASSMTASAVSW